MGKKLPLPLSLRPTRKKVAKKKKHGTNLGTRKAKVRRVLSSSPKNKSGKLAALFIFFAKLLRRTHTRAHAHERKKFRRARPWHRLRPSLSLAFVSSRDKDSSDVFAFFFFFCRSASRGIDIWRLEHRERVKRRESV